MRNYLILVTLVLVVALSNCGAKDPYNGGGGCYNTKATCVPGSPAPTSTPIPNGTTTTAPIGNSAGGNDPQMLVRQIAWGGQFSYDEGRMTFIHLSNGTGGEVGGRSATTAQLNQEIFQGEDGGGLGTGQAMSMIGTPAGQYPYTTVSATWPGDLARAMIYWNIVSHHANEVVTYGTNTATYGVYPVCTTASLGNPQQKVARDIYTQVIGDPPVNKTFAVEQYFLHKVGKGTNGNFRLGNFYGGNIATSSDTCLAISDGTQVPVSTYDPNTGAPHYMDYQNSWIQGGPGAAPVNGITASTVANFKKYNAMLSDSSSINQAAFFACPSGDAANQCLSDVASAEYANDTAYGDSLATAYCAMTHSPTNSDPIRIEINAGAQGLSTTNFSQGLDYEHGGGVGDPNFELFRCSQVWAIAYEQFEFGFNAVNGGHQLETRNWLHGENSFSLILNNSNVLVKINDHEPPDCQFTSSGCNGVGGTSSVHGEGEILHTALILLAYQEGRFLDQESEEDGDANKQYPVQTFSPQKLAFRPGDGSPTMQSFTVGFDNEAGGADGDFGDGCDSQDTPITDHGVEDLLIPGTCTLNSYTLNANVTTASKGPYAVSSTTGIVDGQSYIGLNYQDGSGNGELLKVASHVAGVSVTFSLLPKHPHTSGQTIYNMRVDYKGDAVGIYRREFAHGLYHGNPLSNAIGALVSSGLGLTNDDMAVIVNPSVTTIASYPIQCADLPFNVSNSYHHQMVITVSTGWSNSGGGQPQEDLGPAATNVNETGFPTDYATNVAGGALVNSPPITSGSSSTGNFNFSGGFTCGTTAIPGESAFILSS
jgi:hypothetical protein